MSDLRRISVVACVLLVTVRLCIGWQFLYEGLWKLDTLDGVQPWSSAGYLKNAKGPLQDEFRKLAGDPDDLSWLDYDWVAARWDEYHQRFLAKHPDLTDLQKRLLDEMINGHEDFRAVLSQLPDGVEFGGSLGPVIEFDPQRERLIVDGTQHLTPAERERLLEMAPLIDDPATEEERRQNEIIQDYREAVERVYQRSSRLSYKERLAASLAGDPERAGRVIYDRQGDPAEEIPGDIELYRERLQEYHREKANVEQDFQHAHLQKKWRDLQELRVKLVGPIKAMDAELRDEARKLLDAEQLARGPVSLSFERIDYIDQITIWSLVILGGLLIAGLFSRLAAFGAAMLLLSFYLAMPPWPGVIDFQELPGPEHSFIVDKNLIEIVILLAIAAMPTGQWFGVDAFFRRRIRGGAGSPGQKQARSRRQPAAASAE